MYAHAIYVYVYIYPSVPAYQVGTLSVDVESGCRIAQYGEYTCTYM